MPQTAAEAYGVLRRLSLQEGEGPIISRNLAEARKALIAHGLDEIDVATHEHDQRLLQECRQNEDSGAFLCLRCRVSWPLEQRVRTLHRQNWKNYGVELLALAATVLDDIGHVLPYRQEQQEKVRRMATEPFGAEVIRSYLPERAGLGAWAQQKLMGHRPLRVYLQHQGVSLMRDWALLGDTSLRKVEEAVSHLDGGITPETAKALHGRYGPLYRQAKLHHIQTTGRQQGWEPDDAFLQAVDPARPPGQTKELLERIARAVRCMESGQWLKQEAALFDSNGLKGLEEAMAAKAWRQAEEANGLEDQEIVKLVEEEGMAYAGRLVKELDLNGLERQIWQAWAEGLRQRQIADRCGTNQARVSRTVKEEIRAGEIATLALERLRRALPANPPSAQAALFRSVQRLEEAEGRLMNHLLQPEQEEGMSPLRRWLHHALHAPSACAGGESGCGGGR